METAVIYDICNNTYAYDVYDISGAYTGNALSLIAADNSSNTFLNIITNYFWSGIYCYGKLFDIIGTTTQ